MTMGAKKYTPKDINKNGKLDQWEINKYKLINKGKPQMGMGEQGALKPKFLKGSFCTFITSVPDTLFL